MLGHIPAMIHPEPKSVLIIGCGAGVTSGSFVPYPSIERIVICEIEPLIPRAAGKYFSNENHNVMDDPRVEIVFDDARHYITTTNEKFDIITSDPIHPWVKGAASLYSLEFFELCKKRLKHRGIVTQWVPLYENNPEAVKSQITTFIRAFPDGTIWGNESLDGGYDVVMLGQNEPTKIDIARLNRRFVQRDHEEVFQSMVAVDLGSPLQILATYAGQGSDLEDWLDDRYINRDVNFRLQYLAGMGFNSYFEVEIYDSILKHRKFPDNLLMNASETFKNELASKLRTRRPVRPAPTLGARKSAQK
jgi:spermidine synthase